MINMLSPVNKTTSIDENEQDVKESPSISTYNDHTQKSFDTTLNTNSFNGNQRMVVINDSQPLARYSVLYLGTAIPSDDDRGMDSIQDALSKRYPIDGTEVVQGIEAWLSIDENSLEIQFARDPSVIVYYPIRSLVYCATIRFATRTETGEKFPNGWRFVPLDYPDTNFIENMPTPPLFAITFHRTRSSPMDECHCFVAKTKQAALALVKACHNAYQTTDPEQDCSKVPLYFKINNDGLQIEEIDNEIYTVPTLDEEQSLDYLTNRNTSGFFYKTDQISIDNWKLWEPQKTELQRSSSTTSYRPNRQHRLSSIISIPDNQTPMKSPSVNNLNEQPKTTTAPQLTIDPYAPDPNVIHVECIKDVQTGREVYIRFLRNPPDEVAQPKTTNPPVTTQVNTVNDQPEKTLSNKIQRLTLNDESLKKSVTLNDQPQTIPFYHKRKKSKRRHKHRHHHERKHPSYTYPNYQHSYSEVFDDRYSPSPLPSRYTPLPMQQTYILSPIPQAYITSPMQQTYTPPVTQKTYASQVIQQPYASPPYGMTYHTIELPSPPNNSPFWFYTT